MTLATRTDSHRRSISPTLPRLLAGLLAWSVASLASADPQQTQGRVQPGRPPSDVAPGDASPIPAAPGAASATAAAPSDLDDPHSRTFDVEFGGGTIARYVDAVRQAAGGANIVVKPEAAGLRLPTIAMRGVTVETALAVLQEQIHDDPNMQVVLSNSQAVDPRTGRRRSSSGHPAFVIGAQSMAQARGGYGAPKQTRIESLARIIEEGRFSAEKALDAVEAAVRSTGFLEETTLAYHEPTSLLIVTGPEPAALAAINVLSALSPRRSAADLKAIEERQARLERESADANRLLVEAQTRFEVLQDSFRAREERLRQIEQELLAQSVDRATLAEEAKRLSGARSEQQRAREDLERRLVVTSEALERMHREKDKAESLARRALDRLKQQGVTIDDLIDER